MPEPTTCPACHRPARLNRHGLCASCNLKRYTLDAETEARLEQVVEQAKQKPDPVRARRSKRAPRPA